jgi:membrane protease YdiL (CAAX protease family)
MTDVQPAVDSGRVNGAVLPLVEVTAMTTMLLSYIWIWQERFAGANAACLALYFGIGIAGHWYRGETAHRVGLRIDNLRPAAFDALRFMLPIVTLVSLIGLTADSIDYPPAESWPWRLGSGWVWGIMQQYGLTAFFYRRLLDALRSIPAASITAAALFALFHLPNAFLTAFTLGAGLLSCWLYRRHPNLLVLGGVHALISFVVLNSLPDSITERLHVGP